MLFAATYPERTRYLALFGTYALAWVSFLPDDRREAILDDLIGRWGDGTSMLFFWPEADGPAQAWWGVKERLAGSPEAIRNLWALTAATDVRAALPTVQAPTLVLQRSGPTGGAMREIADSIPGARFVELAGSSGLPWVDADPLVDEIEEFLAGARPTPVADRVLATILFTDIVGSTETAREIGDSAWSRLIEQHHAAVRRELDRYAGEEIDTAGDGFFATFDGPARAIRCALEIQHAVSALGVQIRAGLHTGEVERPRGGKPRGIAVSVAARVSGLAAGGETLVTATIRDLVAGSGLEFTDRGDHELKGLDESRRVFLATAGQ